MEVVVLYGRPLLKSHNLLQRVGNRLDEGLQALGRQVQVFPHKLQLVGRA